MPDVSVTPFTRNASQAIRIALVSGIAVLLGACSSAEPEARKAVLAKLLAADTAQFGAYTEIKHKAACLTVNSLGGNGKPTGDLQAVVFKVDEVWKVADITRISHDECVTAVEQIVAEADKKSG